MAWCNECDRFLNPATVNADGTCPTCGRPVDVAATAERSPAVEALPNAQTAYAVDVLPPMVDDPLDGDSASESDEIPRAPWHFKVASVVVGIYLAFRAVQGVIWLFR